MPGVVQKSDHQLIGKGGARPFSIALRISRRYSSRMAFTKGEKIVRETRIIRPGSPLSTGNYFTFILFQQADGIVFRVSLTVDPTNSVFTDCKMDPRLFALNQNMQACLDELFPGYIVKAGVGNIEQGIDIIHQWVMRIHQVVGKRPPALESQRFAPLTMYQFEYRMGRETGAKCRSDILLGPSTTWRSGFQKGSSREDWGGSGSPGDDQCIQPIMLNLLERLVVLVDVSAAFCSRGCSFRVNGCI